MRCKRDPSVLAGNDYSNPAYELRSAAVTLDDRHFGTGFGQNDGVRKRRSTCREIVLNRNRLRRLRLRRHIHERARARERRRQRTELRLAGAGSSERSGEPLHVLARGGLQIARNDVRVWIVNRRYGVAI